MTQTSATLRMVVGTVILLSAIAPIVALASDARDSLRVDHTRDAGTNSTPPPLLPPPPALPVSLPSGGIVSDTNGNADSGGNTGGEVVTGDESVTVIEINHGPTAPSNPSNGEEADSTDSNGSGDTPCSRRENLCSLPTRTRL